MGCSIFYTYRYLETKDKMGKDKKSKTFNEMSIIEKLVSISQIVAAFAVVAAIILFFFNMQKSVEDIQENIETIQKETSQIDIINNELHSNDGLLDKLGDLEKEVASLKENIDSIKSDLYVPVISATDSAMLTSLKSVSVNRDVDYVAKPLSSELKIGIDMTGKIRYAKEFINETILITYKEEDKDVYFLGQYNEDYHWDGLCITNAYYLDGTLFGICESNFDDGKRLDYKSVCSSETTNGKWIFSERICKEDKNAGINIEYLFDYNEGKKFTNETILTADIFKVDKFLNTVDYKIVQFYYGDTLNECYNDTTGNAYMIKYADDGNVILLYHGNFVNGVFEDTTGNAWDIAYSEEINHYVYNKGKFKNNEYIISSGKSEIVSIEQIREIISNYDFDCDLGNWEVDSMI